MTISVILPAKNEAGGLDLTLPALHACLPGVEIIVVDDGSTDDTASVAAAHGAAVLSSPYSMGNGAAIKRGARAAMGDILVFMDADGQHDPACIPALLAKLDEGYDLVNTTRTWRRPKAMPFANFLANRVFALTARVLHGLKTTDVHSGMRAYRSSVIRAFEFDGEGDALPIDTLVWPARSGFRVVEAPIGYDERVGPSKLRKLSGTAWTFIRLARCFGVGRRGGGLHGSRYEVR